jgi:hypothetical protein
LTSGLFDIISSPLAVSLVSGMSKADGNRGVESPNSAGQSDYLPSARVLLGSA